LQLEVLLGELNSVFRSRSYRVLGNVCSVVVL